MKNLRKIFALLIVTALTFNVSACAGGSSNDSINTSSTPEQSETVSIGDSSETTDNSNQEDFPGEPPEGGPGGTTSKDKSGGTPPGEALPAGTAHSRLGIRPQDRARQCACC